MTAMEKRPPAEAFAALHLSFGLLLVFALAIYLFSTERRPKG
jgi:hypothetical protein